MTAPASITAYEKAKPETIPSHESVQYVQIPGHDGYYAASDGTIWSARARKGNEWRKKSQRIGNSGYYEVQLQTSSYPRRVHSLVLLAFVGERPVGMEASHIDGNRLNNRPENLKYDTHLANMREMVRHGTKPQGLRYSTARFTAEQIIEMRQMYERGVSQYTIADKFNCGQGRVSLIVRRLAYADVL